jgi:hypothetical protein
MDRLHLDLVWAWYHHGAGQPGLMQRHLAAARRVAELNGARALAIEVDARLGVSFLGPTGEAEADVVLVPGERLDLEFRAIDWRGRPLPGYTLHASLEAGHEAPPGIRVTPRSGAAGPGAGPGSPAARTDHLGRAVFTAHAAGPGRCTLFVGDAEAVHGARVRVAVQPCIVESAAGPLPPVELSAEEGLLLRQLFGPGFGRLRVHREFEAGRSGTRVLLVEPFRTGAAGGELRGQPCIVKLGERLAMQDEWQRHERWVKDVLPVNVSRCERHTPWAGRAALRMGLAGSNNLDGARARNASEWLTTATAFDAHLLLERVFVGDLATCWYTNAPSREPPAPLLRTYGRIIPPLLTVRDTDPPRGLLSRQPPGPFADPLDGRCFHPFTRGLARPYDERLSRLMVRLTEWLMRQTGAPVGYTQSDEISLDWYPEYPKTRIFCDGRVLEMVSHLAALASVWCATRQALNSRLPLEASRPCPQKSV